MHKINVNLIWRNRINKFGGVLGAFNYRTMNDSYSMSRQTSFTYEDLLKSSRGELFGPENAQLPAPPMLTLDRITRISEQDGTYGRGEAIAELDINPDLWFFKCHFPGDPVMPGCLGLDAMWQLLGFYLCWLGHPGKGRALAVGEVKFSGQVVPTTKKLIYRLNLKRVVTRKVVLGIADADMQADGVVIYKAIDLRVGLFTSTHNF